MSIPTVPGSSGPARLPGADGAAANAAADDVAIPGVPRIGEILAGKYRVERVLGIGGMGVVVAAIHLDLDERVAVKFLLPQAPGAQPDAVARFVREAKAAIKIRSDHVVRVLDSGRLESGGPYIVMEYLEGRDLHAILESDGPLSIEASVDYVLQACDAIAAAHALGIIHRDLKPGNLFLTRRADGSPLVKVLDFGISKITTGDLAASSGLTTTTTIMGTPAFMPPEQLRSTRHVDTRADIWSLGTVLYALLTGEPPYSGESTADIAAKIIRDPPPPLRERREGVPEGLEAVVVRCLQKEPDGRYPGVAELADALLPFAPEGSRASAARLAKQISSRQLGHAATMRSPSSPAIGPKSDEQATRTASAWGETKDKPQEAGARGDRRDRVSWGWLLAFAIAGAALVGVGLAIAVPRGPASAPSSPAPAAAAPPPALLPAAPLPAAAPARAPAAATALAAASPPPAPAASVPATPPPPASAAPSAKPASPAARANPGHPRPAKAVASGSPSPATPAPPPAASGGGLFDDRE